MIMPYPRPCDYERIIVADVQSGETSASPRAQTRTSYAANTTQRFGSSETQTWSPRCAVMDGCRFDLTIAGPTLTWHSLRPP